MKLYIPHLNYLVNVKKVPAEKPVYNAVSWVQWVKDGEVDVYIKTPVTKTDSSLLAHELIHVLQNIAEDRNIDFLKEGEHMGYLMQWLHGEIMGSKWK